MQLRAFAKLLATWRALGAPAPRPTLIVAGAVRHTDDQRRLDGLRALWAQLSSEGGATDDDVESVVFAPNLPYSALRELLGHAAVGLHTMWNEHFGIGVVEMLAAGVGTIAHRSGGPALDIISEGTTGMLASTDDEYAEAMASLMLRPGAEARRTAMTAKGRASVESRFSEAAFAAGWADAMRPLYGQVDANARADEGGAGTHRSSSGWLKLPTLAYNGDAASELRALRWMLLGVVLLGGALMATAQLLAATLRAVVDPLGDWAFGDGSCGQDAQSEAASMAVAWLCGKGGK